MGRREAIQGPGRFMVLGSAELCQRSCDASAL
jgi:hypothetical protein